MQCSWITLVMVLFALHRDRVGTSRAHMTVSVIIVIALFAGRVGYIQADLDRERLIASQLSTHDTLEIPIRGAVKKLILTNQLKLRYAQDPAIRDMLADLGPASYLVSNFASPLNVSHGLAIRHMPFDSPRDAGKLRIFAQLAKRMPVDRPAYLLLLPTNTMLRQGQWPQAVLEAIPAELSVVGRPGGGLLLGIRPAGV